MIGEPIIGTYWREQYLEVKRQRDEAVERESEIQAENERLRTEVDRLELERDSLMLTSLGRFDAIEDLGRERNGLQTEVERLRQRLADRIKSESSD